MLNIFFCFFFFFFFFSEWPEWTTPPPNAIFFPIFSFLTHFHPSPPTLVSLRSLIVFLCLGPDSDSLWLHDVIYHFPGTIIYFLPLTLRRHTCLIVFFRYPFYNCFNLTVAQPLFHFFLQCSFFPNWFSIYATWSMLGFFTFFMTLVPVLVNTPVPAPINDTLQGPCLLFFFLVFPTLPDDVLELFFATENR